MYHIIFNHIIVCAILFHPILYSILFRNCHRVHSNKEQRFPTEIPRQNVLLTYALFQEYMKRMIIQLIKKAVVWHIDWHGSWIMFRTARAIHFTNNDIIISYLKNSSE